MQYILDIMQYIHYIISMNKVKVARLLLDLKQDDLAQKVGVTRQTIGLIEAGSYNPSLNLCIKICKVLGKTLDEIFWENENE